MPEALTRMVREVAGALRLADALDVLVVAVFVYALINWFRQARSRVVMSGLATLVGLYFVARLLQMTLTLILFQVGITVAAVALIVVFQEEIRRAFERVAFTRPLQRLRQDAGPRPLTDLIVTAAFDLARSRTGALIVLKGKESLDRHLTGGVALGGALSEPLLYSIFDTSSAGHDGALIVEDGLASRFAVHLPLSDAITGQERFGTRHAAALGLSERSDALVVVVSEERGEVSVAQGGKLHQALRPAQLAERLTAFRQRTAPDRGGGLLRRGLVRNAGTKLLSVVIAIGAWLVVHGRDREISTRSYEVPVVLRDVPADLLVEPPRPDRVRVTLSGPERAFQQVDPAALTASIDAAQLKAGLTPRTITAEALRTPPSITVERVEPSVTTLSAKATRLVELPVRVTTSGRVPTGYVVTRITSEPEQVRVRIPVEDLGAVAVLKTAPLSLAGRTTSLVATQPLELPERIRLVEPSAAAVVVKVTIEPR